jgi:hypothetical protein
VPFLSRLAARRIAAARAHACICLVLVLLPAYVHGIDFLGLEGKEAPDPSGVRRDRRPALWLLVGRARREESTYVRAFLPVNQNPDATDGDRRVAFSWGRVWKRRLTVMDVRASGRPVGVFGLNAYVRSRGLESATQTDRCDSAVLNSKEGDMHVLFYFCENTKLLWSRWIGKAGGLRLRLVPERLAI